MTNHHVRRTYVYNVIHIMFHALVARQRDEIQFNKLNPLLTDFCTLSIRKDTRRQLTNSEDIDAL